MKRIVVLGSTGSIGRSCLDVLSRLPDRLSAVGLSGHRQWELLVEQARLVRPRWIALTDRDAARQARAALGAGKGDGPLLPERPEGCFAQTGAVPVSSIEVLEGPEGVERMAAADGVDVVVAAIVGAAGLRGTWAALEAGKTVAVANKETLVMAGPLVIELARRSGATILPVDSEHSAIFQAMAAGRREEVRRVVLTASGGPFLRADLEALERATPEAALKHPTWNMGPKITVDSATLMNKALEVIEARWLFGLEPDQIEVMIHPESVVHSMVEFNDGSVVAQLSPPDMRLPIQYALTYPDRLPGPGPRVNWQRTHAWHFEPPDRERFPALDLGYEVARRGGTAGAALNAANEQAVERFLAGTLRYRDIPRACRAALEQHHYEPAPSLEALLACDRAAREEVQAWKA